MRDRRYVGWITAEDAEDAEADERTNFRELAHGGELCWSLFFLWLFAWPEKHLALPNLWSNLIGRPIGIVLLPPGHVQLVIGPLIRSLPSFEHYH